MSDMKVLSQLHATFSEDHLKEFSDTTSSENFSNRASEWGNKRTNKQIKRANERTNDKSKDIFFSS